jgi:hypothetical protein
MAGAEADIEQFVRALLPFDETLFKSALARTDQLTFGAAVGAGFAVVVRDVPEIFEDRAERLKFCASVSQADVFENKLPVWMVEAAVQSAWGSAAAVAGIAPDKLIEIYVMTLKTIAEQVENPQDLARLVGSAVPIAQGIRRGLGGTA